MILGFNLRDTLRNKRDVVTVLQRNDRLEEIIDIVNEKYVDTVNSDKLYQNAISGILKNLDPHTNYIPAEDMQADNEDLEGSFSGIGVEFSILRDTIQVTSVIDNGPAGNAGVMLGDQLVRVGDSIVAGRHITSDQIIHLLRGKQRSSVLVTLRDPASGRLRELPITRDVIAVHSVEADFLLNKNTGYVRIARFSSNTAKEFARALKSLTDSGATQLIVDLRENPGGYLEAATSVADEFLNEKKLIVYTKGRNAPKTEYRASDKGMFETGRLVVLIDESSASASEILAGAIQDWDRGIVIGRRSFGKGLVQEQYELSDGAGLRLTVAKYFTPSGRCIQRSFAKGRDAYMEDFENRYKSGELTGLDTLAPADTTRFFTANNRVVFGGGGIKPDIYVPYDTAKNLVALADLVYSQECKIATWDYFMKHRTDLKYRSISDFMAHFNGENEMLTLFVALYKGPGLVHLQHVLRNKVNLENFKTQLRAQVARLLFHDNGYYAVVLRDDEMIRKAMAALTGDNYETLLKGKKIIPRTGEAIEATLSPKDQKHRHRKSDDRW